MTAPNNRLERLFGTLARVDATRYRQAFFLLCLGYVLVVLYQAMGYGSAARLFPVLVGVPLVALLVGTLAVSVSGRRSDLSGPLGGVFEELEGHERGTDHDDDVRYRRETAALLWLAALFISIWLLGHLLAAAVYVPTFVYAYERDLRRAAITGVGTAAFLYFLFVELLSASIHGGVLLELI